MTKAETTSDIPPQKGNLPGYAAHEDVRHLADVPFTMQRELSIFEEGDMLAAGLTREDIAKMTPNELKKLADAAVENSDKFLGV